MKKTAKTVVAAVVAAVFVAAAVTASAAALPVQEAVNQPGGMRRYGDGSMRREYKDFDGPHFVYACRGQYADTLVQDTEESVTLSSFVDRYEGKEHVKCEIIKLDIHEGDRIEAAEVSNVMNYVYGHQVLAYYEGTPTNGGVKEWYSYRTPQFTLRLVTVSGEEGEKTVDAVYYYTTAAE